MTKKSRYVPQPHIIAGRKFKVIESVRAYMGRGASPIMATPQTPAAVGRVLGAHEQTHEAITPDITPAECAARIAEKYTAPVNTFGEPLPVDELPAAELVARMVGMCARPGSGDIVNVCEDTRVNDYVRVRLGFGAAEWEPVNEHYAKQGFATGMKQVQITVAECRAAGDGLSTLLALLPLRSKPGADAARTPKKFVGRYVPDTASALEKALILRAVETQSAINVDCTFERVLDAAETLIRIASDLEMIWERERAREEAEGDELAEADEELQKTADEQKAREPENKGRAQWGEMDKETPERPERIPTPRFNQRHRASDTGSIMRFPNRYCVDGAVFSTKRKMPGGTVLVDVSGSMSLTTEQVNAIVANAPLATVAIYSGSYHKGVLRIVAMNGTRVAGDITADMHGSNCVDGPALRWLRTQPEPRIWISDGRVNGYAGSSDPFLVTDAFNVAKAGRIVRVPDADKAISLFRSPSRLIAYIRERFRTGDTLPSGDED